MDEGDARPCVLASMQSVSASTSDVGASMQSVSASTSDVGEESTIVGDSLSDSSSSAPSHANNAQWRAVPHGSIVDDSDEDDDDDYDARSSGFESPSHSQARPPVDRAHRPPPPPPPPPRARVQCTVDDVIRRLGLDAKIMSGNADSRPPALPATDGSTWVPLEKVKAVCGSSMRPVRTMAFNMPISMLESEAANIGSFASCNATMPHATTRARAFAAFWGLMSTALCKGWVSGKNYKLDAEDDRSFKNVDGDVVAHLYRPHASGSDATTRDHCYPQILIVLEDLQDPHGKTQALRAWYLVFDASFSVGHLVGRLIDESARLVRSGSISMVDEAARKTTLQKANALFQSAMTGDLTTAAAVMYRKITSVSQLAGLYARLGGGALGGSSLFPDLSAMPSTAAHPTLDSSPLLGSTNAWSPEFALNPLRDPAVLAFGLVDPRTGNPLEICSAQTNVLSYINSSGAFSPDPRIVGRLWANADCTRTCLMALPLPREIRTGPIPSDTLLGVVHDMVVDSSIGGEALAKARAEGRTTVAELRRELADEVTRISTKKDAAVSDIEDFLQSNIANESIDALRGGGASHLGVRPADGENAASAGVQYVISIDQSLETAGDETARLHAAISRWNGEEQQRLAQRACDDDGLHMRLRKQQSDRMTAVCDDVTRLCLEQFFGCFESKNKSDRVAPGWRSIHAGFKATLRQVDELGTARVDAKHPDKMHGTLCLAHAFDTNKAACDLTVYGEWRVFCHHIFANVAQISGDPTIMTELLLQAYEVAWSQSTYMTLHGEAGAGKSERVKRLRHLLVSGWARSTGTGSEKSGLNGGWDSLCGRLVIYDELPSEFCSESKLEQLKTSATDNCVFSNRTLKIPVAGGETFATVALSTHHLETTVICTNSGMALSKSDTEPDDQRVPLLDRCHSTYVFSSQNAKAISDAEFLGSLEDADTKADLVRFRLVTSLSCLLLMLLKNNSFLLPDTAYAEAVMTRLDAMVCRDFNLPIPTARKRAKRSFTLRSLFVEHAVIAHVWCKEGVAVNAKGLAPLPDGTLPPFEPTQLLPIVRGLQRFVTLEIILLAWNHALNYSTATSSSMLNMRTTLAQYVGSAIDHRVSVPVAAQTQTQTQTQAAAAASAKRAKHAHPYDAHPYVTAARCGVARASVASARARVDPTSSMQDVTARARVDPTYGTREGEPVIEPAPLGGTSHPAVMQQSLAHQSLSRLECKVASERIALTLSVRNAISQTLLVRSLPPSIAYEPFETLVSHLDATHLPWGVTPREAAAIALPRMEDLLRCGYNSQTLVDLTRGEYLTTNVVDAMLGTTLNDVRAMRARARAMRARAFLDARGFRVRF